MQLYTALLLCILVLSLTGGLSPFRSILGLRGLRAAFFAVSMLALAGFDLAFSPETRINVCAIALPAFLALWARKETAGGSLGAPAALVVFSLLAVVAEKAGVFAGANNGLLTGFLAGASAAALASAPRTALAVACTVPLSANLLAGVYDMARGGYVQIDLTEVGLRDGQMMALCFGAVLLCLYAVAKGTERTKEERPEGQG